MAKILKSLRGLVAKMDLQTKITLVLLAVIPPTFLLATVVQHQLAQPIVEEELRQAGINTAKALASEIVNTHRLQMPAPEAALETSIQELLYSQPSIARMDVVVKDPVTGFIRVVASSVEEEPEAVPPVSGIEDTIVTSLKTDDSGGRFWDIIVPIEQKRHDPRAPKKLLGDVHVVVSLQLVERMVGAIWRTTATAAVFSVVTLLLALGFFLRKAVENDRRLRAAVSENLKLAARLQDTERQLMVSEKLAAMGQLTASFAHEIGTPLNAMGGHLQLLAEEAGADGNASKLSQRIEVIQSQISKIEQIVRTFLQNTAKPESQTQLVDVNAVVNRTLGVVHPRIEALGVDLKLDQDRNMGPVRMVPIELEQILLNLVNNSLDSLKTKSLSASGLLRNRLILEIETRVSVGEDGVEWAEVSVYDTGEGISRTDLKNVLKPFFTTKRPGEGTGLGLTICQELAHKYGGMLEIDSRKSSWTRVVLRIPYRRGA